MNTGAQTTPHGGEAPTGADEQDRPVHESTDHESTDDAPETRADASVGAAESAAEESAPAGEAHGNAALDTEARDADPSVLVGELVDDAVDAEVMDAQTMNAQATAGDDDAPADTLAQLAEERARADDNWDRLLRLQAEMENQRKRAQRDVTAARKFALEGIVGDLLPVRDSLEMGLAASASDSATLASLREGSELTLKMLASALEKHNIVAIDPVGEKFNPEFHQAMSMQPVEGAASNTVVSVMQKGYTLNERLVRPALVMVAK